MDRPAGGRHGRRSLATSLRRIRAMAAKETLHIRRDPRTLYLALGMPVVLIVLFGFGVRFDTDHVPLAVVDQDHTAASRRVEQGFVASEDFAEVATPASEDEAERLLRTGTVSAVLVLPPGLGDDVARGDVAPVQLLIDGSDGNSTNQVLQKADGIGRAVGAELAPRPARPPIDVRVWTRFNPTGESSMFLVPGLVAYILAMVAVLLTALSVAREWERGSMEQLFATPVGRFEIVVGKLAPYLGLGFLQTLLVLATGTVAFDLPIRGSLVTVGLASLLFMLGMLGQGLLISVLTRNQMVATQLGTFSSMLPSMLLSGFLFPVQNMPRVLQALSFVVPARWFVQLLREVLLKNAGLDVVWPELIGLAAFAVVMIAASTARFRRKL